MPNFFNFYFSSPAASRPIFVCWMALNQTQQPKVDQTAVYPVDRNSCIFITHINIPVAEGQDQTPVLQRIVPFLVSEYGNAPMRFEITGTYILQNPRTGAIRHWTGSFAPRGQARGVLQEFELFEPTTFVQTVSNLVNGNSAHLQELLSVPETDWIVSHVQSVIVNCQAVVPHTFQTLFLRHLTTPRSNRHVRRHVSYPLP